MGNLTVSEARALYIQNLRDPGSVRPEKIKQIEEEYPYYLKGWKTAAESTDNTKYEITDGQYKSAKNKGEKELKRTGKYHRDEGKLSQGGIAGTTGAFAVGNAAFTAGSVGVNAAANGIKTAAGVTTEVVTEGVTKTVTEVTGKSAASSVGGICFMIGCVMALTSGTVAFAMKNNKEEAELFENILPYLQETNADIVAQEEEMETIQENIEANLEAAEEKNEDLQDGINEEVESNDLVLAMLEGYNNRIASGEKLTKDEAAEYQILLNMQAESSTTIADMEDSASGELEDIYGEMEGYQESYDAVGEKLATSVGVTDQLQQLDEATLTAEKWQIASDAINIASGTASGIEAIIYASAGAWAFGITAWAFAFGAMAFTGVGLSAADMKNQVDYMKKTEAEIGERQSLQDVTVDVQGSYEENLGEYDSQLTTAEEITHIAPTELEVADVESDVSVVEDSPADDGDPKKEQETV